jgi:hypothetical protein
MGRVVCRQWGWGEWRNYFVVLIQEYIHHLHARKGRDKHEFFRWATFVLVEPGLVVQIRMPFVTTRERVGGILNTQIEYQNCKQRITPTGSFIAESSDPRTKVINRLKSSR